MLLRWRVPAELLTVEVTESAIMTELERAQALLGRLHALGVGIAIDDFGAGYTSLSQLQDLPATELKIDQVFVRRLGQNRKSLTIVRSLVDLSHNLGLTATAEGVENQVGWDQLAAAGCDVAQGYHVSRPLPATDLEVWLDQRSPLPSTPCPSGSGRS
jgi:EAL domain-containing protein (putative c-di-GMP-specific phosphodiesterase class I)